MKEILDTRFLITHFFSKDPRILDLTRRKLQDLRRKGEGIVPTMAIVEFFDQVCRRAGRREAQQKCEAIFVSGLEIQSLTVPIALAAGRLRCAHSNVPLADCVIAATAGYVKGRVVSDDPHFKQLNGIKVGWF